MQSKLEGAFAGFSLFLKFRIDFFEKHGIFFSIKWRRNSLRQRIDMSETSQKLEVVAYLKPYCGWSEGVRAIMRKYGLAFEDRDIINDPAQRQEMIEKSGQTLSPCVQINGFMLADVSGEEVEAYLLANKLVVPSNKAADAPTNAPCADVAHSDEEQTIKFKD